MAITPASPIVNAFDITTSFTTMYETPPTISRTVLSSVVFNNYSASNATLSVRIIQSGNSSSLNELITDKEIRSGESYLAPELIGQAIQRGGVIEAKASTDSSINATITATTIE